MQGIWRTGEAIDVTYQAVKNTTGLVDVVMKIYDETRALDGVNFPDVTLTEIGATGRYYGSFTPDAEGVWTVLVDSIAKPGPLVKTFQVTGHNLDSVGDAIAALNNLSAAQVNAEVDTALADYDAPTRAELTSDIGSVNTNVDAAETAIRGADSDTLKTISDQIDGLEGAAMLG